MRNDRPTPKEQILSPIHEGHVEIEGFGTARPMGHTGELRRTKEENRELKAQLAQSEKFLEDARAAFKAKVDVLEADLDRYRQMVSPANAIDLGEFIGPIKPCPFCGSVALERDGFEEHIVCKNCGASAPVSGWQVRASIN